MVETTRFFQQAYIRNDHIILNGLAHIVNSKRSDGDDGQCLHLHIGFPPREALERVMPRQRVLSRVNNRSIPRICSGWYMGMSSGVRLAPRNSSNLCCSSYPPMRFIVRPASLR